MAKIPPVDFEPSSVGFVVDTESNTDTETSSSFFKTEDDDDSDVPYVKHNGDDDDSEDNDDSDDSDDRVISGIIRTLVEKHLDLLLFTVDEEKSIEALSCLISTSCSKILEIDFSLKERLLSFLSELSTAIHEDKGPDYDEPDETSPVVFN